MVEEREFDLLSIVKRLPAEGVYLKLLGYVPSVKVYYKSIFANDSNPSMVFIYVSGSLKYKCFSSGKSGDFIDMTMALFNIDFRTALEYLYDNVFPSYSNLSVFAKNPVKGKGLTKISVVTYPIIQSPKSFVDYWKLRGVSIETLRILNIRAAATVRINDSLFSIYQDKDIVVSYHVGSSAQIYRPLLPKGNIDRFRSNLTYKDMFGLCAIDVKPKHDIGIITSSGKDVAVCRAAGFNSIAGTTESRILEKEPVELLKSKCSDIILLYDNDSVGRKWGKDNADVHGVTCKFIPNSSGCKDPDDFALKYGIASFESMVLNCK